MQTSSELLAPDINVVRPLSDADGGCLREIREVLERHQAMDRFGLVLLHSHFPMAADEVLVEACDPQTRTLTLKPVPAASLPDGDTIQTSWSLNSSQALVACTVRCKKHERGPEHLPD